jgi:tetratricopeptide (TPR) repeat protein
MQSTPFHVPFQAIRSIGLALAGFGLAGATMATGTMLPVAQAVQSHAGAGTAQPTADLDALRQQALDEGQTGKTDSAIRDYRRALELDPGWKEGAWNLGMLEYGSGQFPAARATFERVVGFAPNLGSAWSFLGLCEFETGSYSDALAHLKKAQSLGVDDADIARVSTYHLGLLLIRDSAFDQASDLLQAAFGHGNMSTQAKIALGLALLRVPVLPLQLDPSREALVLAAGEAAAAGADEPARLADLVRDNPDLPYLHYAYGVSLATNGRDKAAQQALLEETKISPASPLPWIELSRIELSQGKSRAAASQALKLAQHAVEVAPDNREAHQALAQAWEAAGRPEQAADERKLVPEQAHGPLVAEQRMIHLYASTAAGAGEAATTSGAALSRALQEYSAGQYAAAIPDLKAALAGAPENGTVWAMLGLCEFAVKDFDNALIHLDRGARLGLSASADSLHEARYTYGILLVHAGQFDRAADVLLSAREASGPFAAKVQFALGLALLRLAEFPDAAKPSQEELIAAAGSVESHLLQSQYDQALPQLKDLLKRYPAAPFLHYAYGTALIALSQFDEAEAEMKEEIAISPASPLPCQSLASIALRRRDSASAVQWAERALQLAPDSVDAHYLLGRASLESGDVTAALRELQGAARLSPASPEIHFNLAKAYARAKMPAEAEQERAIFARLNEAASQPGPRSPQRGDAPADGTKSQDQIDPASPQGTVQPQSVQPQSASPQP